jgi:hypothetical protein
MMRIHEHYPAAPRHELRAEADSAFLGGEDQWWQPVSDYIQIFGRSTLAASRHGNVRGYASLPGLSLKDLPRMIDSKKMLAIEYLSTQHDRVDVIQGRHTLAGVSGKNEQICISPCLDSPYVLPAVHDRVIVCRCRKRFSWSQTDSMEEFKLEVKTASRHHSIG